MSTWSSGTWLKDVRTYALVFLFPPVLDEEGGLKATPGNARTPAALALLLMRSNESPSAESGEGGSLSLIQRNIPADGRTQDAMEGEPVRMACADASKRSSRFCLAVGRTSQYQVSKCDALRTRNDGTESKTYLVESSNVISMVQEAINSPLAQQGVGDGLTRPACL